MSDAQAAAVTENGVPPTAQDEVPGSKLFAGNLTYATTEDGLKAFFAPVQTDVVSVQIIYRGPRPAGYGFVTMSSAEAAQKAVDTLNKVELDGRQVIIEIAKPADQKDKERKEKKSKRRSGRRGGKAVPGEVSEAEATGDANKDTEGNPTAGIDEASKPKKKKKKPARKPKRKAEGAETSADGSAAPAGDAATTKKEPRARNPRRAARPAGEDPVGEPSKTTVFVANLGFNIDDAGLSTLFTDAGINVVSARVVLRRWGQPRRSKGYGFVDVGSEEEQQKAIAALEGKDVDGRSIAVKVAVNSPPEDEGAESKADAPAETEAVTN